MYIYITTNRISNVFLINILLNKGSYYIRQKEIIKILKLFNIKNYIIANLKCFIT